MKYKTAENEDYILKLQEENANLTRRLIMVEAKNSDIKQDLEDLKEKYALLLRKHIDMMERCVGIIPKIRRPEQE
jgi:predicted RNase H-like nuclease (RuvC/YqgF family)